MTRAETAMLAAAMIRAALEEPGIAGQLKADEAHQLGDFMAQLVTDHDDDPVRQFHRAAVVYLESRGYTAIVPGNIDIERMALQVNTYRCSIRFTARAKRPG